MEPVVSTVGLILDIVGVGFLFFWGPPLPVMEGGVGIALESGTSLGDGRTVADEEAQQRRTRRIHITMSRVGLAFIAIGFALQLIAQWV